MVLGRKIGLGSCRLSCERTDGEDSSTVDMANLRKISHLTPSTTMGKMLAFLLLGLLTAPLAAALNVQFCNSMNTNTDTSSKATCLCPLHLPHAPLTLTRHV